MLSDADRKKCADILMNAQKERKQAVQLSTTFPGITIEDSYAISTEVANRKIAAGAKLIGHKVGLTSKAMQRSSIIEERCIALDVSPTLWPISLAPAAILRLATSVEIA